MGEVSLASVTSSPAAASAPAAPLTPADPALFGQLIAQAAPGQAPGTAAVIAECMPTAPVLPQQADDATDAGGHVASAEPGDDGDPIIDPMLAALLQMPLPPAPVRPASVPTGDTAAAPSRVASPALQAPALPGGAAPAPAQPSADDQATARAVLAMIEAGGTIVDPSGEAAPSPGAPAAKADAPAPAATPSAVTDRPAPVRERQAAVSTGDLPEKAAPKPTRDRARAIEIAPASADTLPTLAATGPAMPAAPSPTDIALDHAIAGAREGQFLDQIARDIARTGAPDSQLNFKLDPAHLGPLSIHIAQGADGASVRMSSEDAHTRHMLAEAQPRLAAEARAQGLTLRETSVDVGDRRGGGRDQAAAWAGRDDGHGQRGSQPQAPRSSPDDKTFRVNAGSRQSAGPASGSARYA